MKGLALSKLMPFTNRGKVRGCLVVLPLLIALIPLVMLFNRTVTIYPAPDLGNRISALTDRIWNGQSVIREFAYDQDQLVLKYRLKEGAPNPLVFITLNLGLAERPFDLSDCDTVSLRIKKATTKRIMLFIKTYVPGVSLPEPQNAQTLRHNQYILQLIPGCHQYTIRLKDFQTPAWWCQQMKINPVLLPPETFQKVMAFDLQFNQEGSDYLINKPERIVIEKIAFHLRLSPCGTVLIGVVLLYYLVLGGVWLKGKTALKVQPLPPHKALELSSYREQDLLRIKEFIEANYHLAGISTSMIAEKLGIPSARVFELMREEYQLTFKQLINQMRIDEAKRLLKTTDLRITDIAFNLGFNNVSYFNNLFKMAEGQTPSEYRESNKNLK